MAPWDNDHYRLIADYYSDPLTQRSGALYLAQIEQSLAVLDRLEAADVVKEAYCLHPMMQSDADLRVNLRDGSRLLEAIGTLNPLALLLAVEFRGIANQFLAFQALDGIEPEFIRLSPLEEVNLMLVADKVRHRASFERDFKATHARADAMARYFATWFARLGISEELYDELCAAMPGFS